ncbi:RYamide receptor-like [Watersipora subatra]|uniref:RYamide receptor-like n=1 Tax=Watersipora subatra TaxID=2589382 RepID=UPI00355BF705
MLYILAILLGASGNITSLVVFTNGRRCNTDIRAFLINLALADLLMAVICLPFSFSSALLYNWTFPEPLCPIILFMQVLSVTVSVYTNTAISIDRFIAIRYPLKLLRTTRKHVLWVIALIWIVSSCLCSVQLWVARAKADDQGLILCKEWWPEGTLIDIRKVYTIALLIITYVIPVLVIISMYSLVCVQLWYRTTPGVEDHARDIKQLNNRRKVIKMLMTMSLLFTLCWMPLYIFFLIEDFGLSERDILIIYFSVNWLAMSNSFQNPIIYGFLNDNFRSDLAELVLRCCPILSKVNSIQRAARANPPLHRLSTKMTLISERGDSRADLFKHGRRSVSKCAETPSNGLARKHNRRPIYGKNENTEDCSKSRLIEGGATHSKHLPDNVEPCKSIEDECVEGKEVIKGEEMKDDETFSEHPNKSVIDGKHPDKDVTRRSGNDTHNNRRNRSVRIRSASATEEEEL